MRSWHLATTSIYCKQPKSAKTREEDALLCPKDILLI